MPLKRHALTRFSCLTLADGCALFLQALTPRGLVAATARRENIKNYAYRLSQRWPTAARDFVGGGHAMHIEIMLPYPPTTGNHQYGVTRRGRRYTLPAVERYRAAVRLTWLGARLTRIGGAVRVWLDLWPPDARRRDADNAEKLIFDALVRAGVIDDDSCIRVHTTTWYDAERGGRVEVGIAALGNEDNAHE